MPTQCDINFDNPSGVYYSGQEVSGTVNLLTESEKTVRAIHITILGYAKVRWTETRTRVENRVEKTYEQEFTAFEEYVSYRSFVAGYEGGSSFRLNPGNYQYSFGCALPHPIPTSFDGPLGHIRYEVIVTIDRPLAFDNVFKQAFTVISPLDLNYDPRYRTPDHREDNKTFCCCCCASDPLEVRLSIPFRGYVPGQNLNFTLYMDNESSVDIGESIVRLQQEVIFESRCPSQEFKTLRETITEKRVGRVLRLSRKEYKESLVIPSIPPSTLDICKCIKIRYYLYAKISAGDCYDDMYIYIPVTIGTVPLMDIQQDTTNDVITWEPAEIRIMPSFPNLEGDKPPSYESMIPPSYLDAIKLTEKFRDHPEEDKHKTGPFVPKYPVFENYGPPSAPPVWEM